MARHITDTGRLHLKLKTGPEAAREGRHALERLTDSIPEAQFQALRLLVTELLTNSIRHGASGSRNGWISLDVEVQPDAVRAVVTDPGPGFEPPDCPRPHSDRPGGWGLCLVDRLADRWGVARRDRTEVWFEMDRGLAAAA